MSRKKRPRLVTRSGSDSAPSTSTSGITTRLRRARSRSSRVLIALAVVLGGLSLPYLVTSLGRFFSDVVLYNGRKLPGNLSWQIVLLGHHYLSPHGARLLTYALLALFAVALFLFTWLDLYTYCLVAILLFIVLSKVVIEQYFLWPMPFLILAALDRRSWASWGLLILLSVSGMLINPYIHPWTERVPAANVAIALCILVYALTRRPAPEQAPALAHHAPESPSVPQGENL